MYKTKEAIQAWLNHMNIKNYTINDDLTVDVNDWVDLSKRKLTEIPVQFGTVIGCFSVWDNDLTSLKGCPFKVTESFNCSKNKLTSLEYCPQEVGHVLGFDDNLIFSVEYAPKVIGTLSLHDEITNKNILDISSLNFRYFKHDCHKANIIPMFKDFYGFYDKFMRPNILSLTSQEFHAVLLKNKLQLEIPQNEVQVKRMKI
jgi:hypothetical protein